jgi:hypothetical protein
MQRSFNEVVEQIIEKDPRYGKEAYLFLKEALEDGIWVPRECC